MSSTQSPKQNKEDLKQYFLVLRCQVGDERAFRDLYELFNERTKRYLTGLVGENIAEDLNQEVWLTVYKRVSTLSNVNGFRTWLFQITRNRALDHFRASNRQSEFRDVLKQEANEPAANNEDDSWMQDSLEKLTTAMQSLVPKHHESIVLNFLEGMDYEEIALITGCSTGTVKSRIHNAKLNLKNFMNAKFQNNEQSK